MKSSFMKDNGIFPMEVHISKTENDDDWCFKMRKQKERFPLLQLNLSVEKFWKGREGFFLTRETRKVDMYFDNTLKTQAFVSWKRFLNLATRTHQGNFVMKIVRFKRKGSNRESRAFLKNTIVFTREKNWCKAEIITGDIFGKPTFQVLWGLWKGENCNSKVLLKNSLHVKNWLQNRKNWNSQILSTTLWREIYLRTEWSFCDEFGIIQLLKDEISFQ